MPRMGKTREGRSSLWKLWLERWVNVDMKDKEKTFVPEKTVLQNLMLMV